MKLFIIWDKDGNVAKTEINPLESTTRASNVSLHIMYSAKAIYSVHASTWLKNHLAHTTLTAALGSSGYENVGSDYGSIPACDPVEIDSKIVGLQNDVFYVGPELAAKKAKAVKPEAAPAAPSAVDKFIEGEAQTAFA